MNAPHTVIPKHIYSLDYNEKSIIKFQPATPNMDYLYLLSGSAIKPVHKSLVEKIWQNLGVKESENSFSPYVPQLFLLNYYLQHSSAASNIKTQCQSVALKLYNLINLDSYYNETPESVPDIANLYYPQCVDKKEKPLYGELTLQEIENRTQNYLTYKHLFKEVWVLVEEYKNILALEDLLELASDPLTLKIDALSFTVEIEKDIPINNAFKNKILQDALFFDHLTSSKDLLAYAVNAKEKNVDNLITKILSPSNSFWCLAYLKEDHAQSHVHNPIELLLAPGDSNTTFSARWTHSFLKCYKGSLEEIENSLRSHYMNHAVALYFENNEYKHYQFLHHTPHEKIIVFAHTLDAHKMKNQLSEALPSPPLSAPHSKDKKLKI